MVRRVGLVGLGHMGSVLAANLVGSGFAVVTHDVAGPANSPPGATFLGTVEELARQADVVVCSLPDGEASEQVAGTIVRTQGRSTGSVVDTSTVGVAAARSIDRLLSAAGIGYVDAPVSGGVGARGPARSRSCTPGAPPCARRSSRCWQA